MEAPHTELRLSDKAVQEFRAIFEREFKKTISDDEARERAESFMRLILLLLRPSPKVDGRGSSPESMIESAVDK